MQANTFMFFCIILLICVLFDPAVLNLATKTKSKPTGKLSSSSEYAALITLFARFRTTALPIFLLTVIPILFLLVLFFSIYITNKGED